MTKTKISIRAKLIQYKNDSMNASSTMSDRNEERARNIRSNTMKNACICKSIVQSKNRTESFGIKECYILKPIRYPN